MNNIQDKLAIAISTKIVQHPISFIVMNKRTHDSLCNCIPSEFRMNKITKYCGYNILISEDVLDDDFKIG